jgi:hypothetical protein
MPATILFKKNYLAMVRNAALGENHMFQNFSIAFDGTERDALRGGKASCGTFLSSVLYLQNSTLEFLGKPRWIRFVHANVTSVEKDMQECGWVIIPEPREGAIITWEAKLGEDGLMHLHSGFCIGNDRAVSNGSNSTLMPEEHHVTYEGTRKIDRIWWHPELDAD